MRSTGSAHLSDTSDDDASNRGLRSKKSLEQQMTPVNESLDKESTVVPTTESIDAIQTSIGSMERQQQRVDDLEKRMLEMQETMNFLKNFVLSQQRE
ncbi:hypothetical protein BGX26_003725 [Mortierella sp. AD094]|nr:hypothetical protein BGX26_003725 [Mortierella sp. AD094]